MDFRVEHEIRVIRKVVKHVHGPCLMCEREIEYGGRVPRLGMIWLAQAVRSGCTPAQFESRSHRRGA